jgi:hypothetical protein
MAPDDVGKVKTRGSIWSRDELIIVLDLYCRLPRGRFTDSEPEVVETARMIDRTPGAVAMRLANYMALDDRSGAAGLAHSGIHARRVWEEFRGDAAQVSAAAAAARAKIIQS